MTEKYEPLSPDFDKLIADYYEHFKSQAAKYYQPHKLTRRAATSASFFILISACYMLASLSLFQNTPVGSLSRLGDTLFFDIPYPKIATALLSLVIFAVAQLICKSTLCDRYRVYFFIVSTGLAALVFFEWQEVMPIFFALGLVIFILSYSINRKFGYTRAWSRNRLYAEKVRFLDARFKSGVIFRDKAHEELFKLLEQFEEQTHLDTMNDYISYGNSAFNVLKGLRK
ncbi:hypothetical protein [Pseudoalteromonas byunsanensis]|uniref:Uncharacterized protein n=1 Tax=Pseudoalteromonas byunsanensis TaxID=327939 RepID=A0A1S1MX14_9GAMM|nr:hypothetical protein [Pseudoalteromonas byunsanensis]OHU93442.1 hypothetical protein BIW53_18965 [Pseudoalteromonas byunsanensis]